MFLEEMGLRIMRRRKALHLSQEQVAEMTGLTTQTISTAERGIKALRPENIVKLCAALGITPNDLLLGDALSAVADSDRLSQLTPEQRICLDQILDGFFKAISSKRPEN